MSTISCLHFCECGCGLPVKNRFVRGHPARLHNPMRNPATRLKNSLTQSRIQSEVQTRPEVLVKKSASAKNAQSNPEVRAKIALSNSKPEVRARRSASATAANLRPEVSAKRNQKEIQNRPELKARIAWIKSAPRFRLRLSLLQREIQNRPGVREALSLKVSRAIAAGTRKPHSNHKQGYYRSVITGFLQHYSSSYELRRMQFLDKTGLYWEKSHGISIPYTNVSGQLRGYTPDFLVTFPLSGECWIEEIKGFVSPNDQCKFTAARNFCQQRSMVFRVLLEPDLEKL